MRRKDYLDWVKPLEKYFKHIPSDLQREVRQYLEEYYDETYKSTLSNSDLQDNHNYFTLRIPTTLQTPMLQYIEFFKDYVQGAKGKEVVFDVKRDEQGLILITNGNTGVSLLDLGEYFQEYIDLIQVDLDKWIPDFEKPTSALEADIFRAKVERQVTSLRSDLNIANLENQYLNRELSDRNAQINFLQTLSQNLQQDIRLLIQGKSAEQPDVDQLALDIISQVIKMQERKYSHQLEDLHNDVLTDFLRQKGYHAYDQTRSGRSKLTVGEVDIMIRKEDGTPFSIIEAFRLDSCGAENKTIAAHLDKLIHDYDTTGHTRNFVMVYAEAKNFEQLWSHYKTYVSELNGKPSFRAEYPLISFEESTQISEKSSIKVGIAKHRREGNIVEVYHIFANMFG